MPRIELRDPVGMSYRIDTLELHRIRSWLEEWLPRLFEGFPDEPGNEPLVHIYPLPCDERGAPDWPFDTRLEYWFKISRDPDQAMKELRAKKREMIVQCEQLRAKDKAAGR